MAGSIHGHDFATRDPDWRARQRRMRRGGLETRPYMGVCAAPRAILAFDSAANGAFMVLVDRHALDRGPRPASRQGSTMALAIVAFIAFGLAACGFIGYALWPTWPSAETALDAP